MNIILGILSLFTSKAYAHVGYVVGQQDFAQNLGRDTGYFFSPLSNKNDLLMIFFTLVGVFVLYFLAWKIKPIRNRIIALRARLDTYEEYVPWILRLSLGIALIGASVAHVLISPVLQVGAFAGIELIVGFALLAGFLVVPSAIVALILYVVALSQSFYIVGNLELASALISLLILGSMRPGLDDLFGVPHIKTDRFKKYAPLLLRLGIGGALVFLSLYEKVLNPHVSDLVLDKYGLNNIIPVGAAMWVFAVGMIELAVGLLILIGFQTRLVTAVAFVVLMTTFFFFKEEVYSHVTLFGVLSALFITGAGPWSLDGLLKRRRSTV
jgi:uncharacterized membrane protein YphA (DoxX/SURF4 family)